MVEQAIAETSAILLPTLPDNYDQVIDDMMKLVTLLSLTATPDRLRAWADVVLETVSELPYEMLMEALWEARGKCSFTNQVVPFLVSYCERMSDTPRKHLDALTCMVEFERARDQ